MSTIVTIVGARPQFVKAAVVSRRLRSMAGMRELLVHTGQHYDENMSQVFFDELDIPRPDYSLAVGSGKHGETTGKMIALIEEILLDVKPDWVLVYGDTNSTLAGAVAAAKLNIPLAHVEAGLRSFNRRMPEEVNRVLTDHASQLLFAPTEAAVAHLLREGIDPSTVHLVGDVMYDAATYYADGARRSQIYAEIGRPERYVLATIHRAENTDDPRRLAAIVDGLLQVAADVPVVLPLHPRTRGVLQKLGRIDEVERRLKLLQPVGYLDMIALERGAAVIATDSGGVQKEAYFQRVPCVTLRDETEWVELVESGWNRLTPPTDAATIADSVRQSLQATTKPIADENLYGGGRAAERIVEQLTSNSVTAAAA